MNEVFINGEKYIPESEAADPKYVQDLEEENQILSDRLSSIHLISSPTPTEGDLIVVQEGEKLIDAILRSDPKW